MFADRCTHQTVFLEVHHEASSQRNSHGCLMFDGPPWTQDLKMYRYEMKFSKVLISFVDSDIFVAVTSWCRSKEVEALYGVDLVTIV